MALGKETDIIIVYSWCMTPWLLPVRLSYGQIIDTNPQKGYLYNLSKLSLPIHLRNSNKGYLLKHLSFAEHCWCMRQHLKIGLWHMVNEGHLNKCPIRHTSEPCRHHSLTVQVVRILGMLQKPWWGRCTWSKQFQVNLSWLTWCITQLWLFYSCESHIFLLYCLLLFAQLHLVPTHIWLFYMDYKNENNELAT